MDILTVLSLIIGIIAGFLIGRYVYDKAKWADKRKAFDAEWRLKYASDLAEIKDWVKSAEKYMRYDAVKISKRTLLGKLWEQVSPYLPKFPFKPSDMRFLGSPIDFVIFDGASENDIKQVIFLEIKSGNSNLSAQQIKLKQAIEEGRVSWKLFNIKKPDTIKKEEEKEKEKISGETAPHELYQKIDEKINSATNSGNTED